MCSTSLRSGAASLGECVVHALQRQVADAFGVAVVAAERGNDGREGGEQLRPARGDLGRGTGRRAGRR